MNHWIKQSEKKKFRAYVYMYVEENGNCCRVGRQYGVTRDATEVNWTIDDGVEADGMIADYGEMGVIITPFSSRMYFRIGDTIKYVLNGVVGNNLIDLGI